MGLILEGPRRRDRGKPGLFLVGHLRFSFLETVWWFHPRKISPSFIFVLARNPAVDTEPEREEAFTPDPGLRPRPMARRWMDRCHGVSRRRLDFPGLLVERLLNYWPLAALRLPISPISCAVPRIWRSCPGPLCALPHRRPVRAALGSESQVPIPMGWPTLTEPLGPTHQSVRLPCQSGEVVSRLTTRDPDSDSLTCAPPLRIR